MNPSIMEPASAGDSRNRHVGLGLALLIVLYIAAVVAFIVFY